MNVALMSVSMLASLSLMLRAAAPELKPPSAHFDLSHWKLTLPVDSAGAVSGKAVEIPAAKLRSGYASEWFHAGPDATMIFWAPVNGARTENTAYPRSELRELIDPSDDSACWLATGSHILEARCRVLAVPSSGKVVIGQIHGYSGAADPLIKLQYFKGKVQALVKDKARKGKDITLNFPEVGLNKDFDYSIELKEGILRITVNGSTQSENVFERDPEWSHQTLYFKVGAYTQDNEGPATEGARVAISDLKVSHTMSAKRN